MSELRVVSEDLGGSPLARAALGRAPIVASWYGDVPQRPDAWRRRAESIRQEFAGGEWLGALAGALSASGPAAARLSRSARGKGVVVTTGQQPGLFGGPILTWLKALSALALADAIETSCGIPAAPVFWAATDDADYEEARWTQVAVTGGVDTLRLPPPVLPGAPMGVMPLPDVSDLIPRLEHGAGSATYPEMLERVREAYAPGATVGGAFVALLRAALEPLAIAVLDASHADTRRAAFPVLRRALERAPQIRRALSERTAAIEAAGFTPQVTPVAERTLVFDAPQGTDDKSRIPLAMAASIAKRAIPGQLGSTVLLRPIVERSILPTLAYCGGPGEIAYFAQVSAVAEAMDASAPVVVPRWSGTIIEPHVARILARRRLTLDDLRDRHAAEARLARDSLPEAILRALRELERSLEEAVRRLGEAVAGEAPPLLPPAVVEGNRRILELRVRRLERRVLAAAKRRDEEMVRDVATARGALFPDGKRQERALNFIPLAARHGPPLVSLLQERVGEHASVIVGLSANERVPAAAAAGGGSRHSDDLGVS